MQKINVRNLMRLSNNNQVRELHIILGNKNLNKIKEIQNIDYSSVSFKPSLMTSDSLSFSIYKKVNGRTCSSWDDIVDNRIIYVKEYDEWFEVSVVIDESESITKKNITGTSLCEAELSQIQIYDTEINTEDDIAREDYVNPSVLYNPESPENSILHRVLEKAPHYSIMHVDDTIKNIQRSFSINDVSIYDFLTNNLAQEIGCLFLFNTNERGIYVYDLEYTCLSCGHRDNYHFDTCPACGEKIIHDGYGYNTKIYVDKETLGDNLQLSPNSDQIKNCMKISGGDDIINATIRDVNPNGTQYIYYFNENDKKDMESVEGLTEKIQKYNALIKSYDTKEFQLNEEVVTKYNTVISYIKSYYPEQDVSLLNNSYQGWANISALYYNALDIESYITDSMLPTPDLDTMNAKEQLSLLNSSNMQFAAVDKDTVVLENISIYTANNVVLSLAKAIINTAKFKVSIVDSQLESQVWSGIFKVESRTDDEDTAENTEAVIVNITDDVTGFINQKIEKSMAKLEDNNLKDLYKIKDLDDFKKGLHKYCKSQLESYSSAYQTALDVLTEKGVSDKSNDLYSSMYLPYFERKMALETEVSYRTTQISYIIETCDMFADLIEKTHSELDIQKYLGESLWKAFVSYKRETTYSNDNYVSDGLSNDEIVKLTNELIETAKKELVKSSTSQFTISATLQDLLLLRDENNKQIFEPILDDFTLGNFINVKIDGVLYRVRLSDISIDYNDLTKIEVTFTDLDYAGNTYDNSIKELLSQSKNLATTYSGVTRKSKAGDKASKTLDKMQKEGLDSALYNMQSAISDIKIDEHGILGRNWNDATLDYDDEQLRLGHNYLIFTNDKWRTAISAIGKQKYHLNGVDYVDYGLNTNFVLSGKVIAGDIYSADYKTNNKGELIKGTHLDLNTGSFDLADGKIKFDSSTNKLSIKLTDDSQDLSETITKIEDVEKKIDSGELKGTGIDSVVVYYYLSSSNTELKDGEWVTTPPSWENGKYIWTKTITTLTDNQVTETQPVCITGANGRDGIDGKDGTSTYFHIKYSNVENPTSSQMTETPSIYIGTYVDTNPTDSNNPSDYKWYRFQGLQGEKGEDGIPGVNGKDGTTQYLHIKYSNDGKTFTDNNGETAGDYIGQYVDFEEKDSNVFSDYTWSKVKGNGVKSIVEEYYLSSSNTELKDGEWTSVVPVWKDGRYIWTRNYITWSDDTTSTTTAVLANALNDALKNANDALTKVTKQGSELNILQDKISSKVWKQDITTAVSELQIGGRNLVKNSNFSNNANNWSNWGSPAIREIVTIDGKKWAHVKGTGDARYQGYYQNWNVTVPIEKTLDTEYTFSARVKGASANQEFWVMFHWRDEKGNFIGSSGSSFMVSENEQIVTSTFKTNNSENKSLNEVGRFTIMLGVNNASTVYEVYFTDVKFEKGNKVTSWSPAPEDTDSSITTLSEQYTALNQTVDSISATASGIYATKDSLKAVEAKLELKVDTKKLVSEINASADKINLTSDRLSWTSTYSGMSEDGTLNCKNINITGGTIKIDLGKIQEDTIEATWNFLDLQCDYLVDVGKYHHWQTKIMPEGAIWSDETTGYSLSLSNSNGINIDMPTGVDTGLQYGLSMYSAYGQEIFLGRDNLQMYFKYSNHQNGESTILGKGSLRIDANHFKHDGQLYFSDAAISVCGGSIKCDGQIWSDVDGGGVKKCITCANSVVLVWTSGHFDCWVDGTRVGALAFM